MKRHSITKRIGFCLLLTGLCLVGGMGLLQAAYLENVPVTLQQPDGETVELLASGDEFRNWLHDKDGFVVIRDPETGILSYAVEEEEALVSSGWALESIDPGLLGTLKGRAPSLFRDRSPAGLFPEGSPATPEGIHNAPRKGTINNLVIFIRFSDETEFTDAISTYDTMFNATTTGANSMRNYYGEVSYGQLAISTTFYPTAGATVLSYQDTLPRAYYQPYNATTNTQGYQNDTERTNREHTLLKNAVNRVSAWIPASLVVDGDNDGKVDNVCFIVKGGPDGWNALLWPHMWSLYSQTAYINGKQVYTYNFQLRDSLASSGVGVLCHEMFHSLGAPDLYHYTSNGIQPVGKWDLMEVDRNPPQHMGAYMKFRYGTWISSIPEITQSGTYSLSPLTSSTGNCYKIRSPYSSTEYFVLEYRQKAGTFESSVPGTGLIVYRINTIADGVGNKDGPPDEVYVYRPDGTPTVNGYPDIAFFSASVGRTAINDSTNPSSFLSGGGPGGLSIPSIGAAGATISFAVSIGTSSSSSLGVDFGSSGLWSYKSAWSQLAGWNPQLIGGWNQGLAAEFGSGLGLWTYNGSTWGFLTSWRPATVLKGWVGGLAMGFGSGAGLWSYSGSSWSQLAGWDPLVLADWNQGLAVGFGSGRGLWSTSGSSWNQLAGWDPVVMARWGNNLAVGFGSGRGLWSYNGASWSQIAGWDPVVLMGWNQGLAVGFGSGRGLWSYNGTSWSQIAGWDPVVMEAQDQSLAVGFGSGRGLWLWNGTAWSLLTNWQDPAQLAAYTVGGSR